MKPRVFLIGIFLCVSALFIDEIASKSIREIRSDAIVTKFGKEPANSDEKKPGWMVSLNFLNLIYMSKIK